MIFLYNIHKYTQAKKKIGTETKVIEASCLEDFHRKAIKDAGLITHDLHFFTLSDDRSYLYRVKIQRQSLTYNELQAEMYKEGIENETRSTIQAVPYFDSSKRAEHGAT